MWTEIPHKKRTNPVLFHCWHSVEDGGPTIKQHWKYLSWSLCTSSRVGQGPTLQPLQTNPIWSPRSAACTTTNLGLIDRRNESLSSICAELSGWLPRRVRRCRCSKIYKYHTGFPASTRQGSRSFAMLGSHPGKVFCLLFARFIPTSRKSYTLLILWIFSLWNVDGLSRSEYLHRYAISSFKWMKNNISYEK